MKNIVLRNVLEAAKMANIGRIIHFSSAAVLSVRKDDYAKTKLEGEELVKNLSFKKKALPKKHYTLYTGLEYCILQPSIMYGPTDDKNIGFLIGFAKKFPCFPIPGHSKWPRQPIYIDDFTPDQVGSLTAGEIFPNYAWWEEFNIDITSFEKGVKKMVDFD